MSVKRIKADAAYWQELGDLLGWRLHGFTFREHGTFVTPHVNDSLPGLTGVQRDDIVRAIREASNGTTDNTRRT